ncbi:uncharacterized protein [Nicotiana tomentosiformis]|uniref:uncharacterized protein n=1 Tax=Nicotiana tomentosiformis TaxID=4098 RepID=UPI00388CBDBD
MVRQYSEIQLLLNNLTANDHNWQGDGESRRAIKQKAAGVIELDDFSVMRTNIAKLANQMNRMTMHQTQQMHHVQQMSTCCELCGDSHTSDMCPTNPESIYYVGQQIRGLMNQHAQYGDTCNPNWKNHPTFSCSGNQPTQNHYSPQGNFNQPQKPPQRVEESTNDLLKKLLLDNQQLLTDFRNLERQMGQLTNGRELEEVPKKRKYKPIPEGELIPKATHKSKKHDASSEQVNATRPPPPFPQRLQKKNDDRMFNKFLSMLSQVQLNMSLVDVLHEIPKYAKYIKDIVAHKRRFTEFKTIALTEECTSRVQNKLPQKLKDPGSFTILVQIGNIDVGCALCDLEASINLMPLSLFKQLDLGAPRPTTLMLQLADRSIAYLEGVIEDVLLQIGKFIFPADFIVLDYEAGDAIIKVRKGKMIMRVDNKEAVFNVYRAIQLPRHYEELSTISVMVLDEQLIDTSVYLDDSLEKALMLFDSLEIDDDVEEMMNILDASCDYM